MEMIEKPTTQKGMLDAIWILLVGLNQDGLVYKVESMLTAQKRRPEILISAVTSIITASLGFAAGVVIALIQRPQP